MCDKTDRPEPYLGGAYAEMTKEAKRETPLERLKIERARTIERLGKIEVAIQAFERAPKECEALLEVGIFI